MRLRRGPLTCFIALAAFCGSVARAAGPDVCKALPLETVRTLVHQDLVGMRADVSEEAHSYACAYGAGGLVSVSVIRPGGAAAFLRTSGRYAQATAITGLGDKALYDRRLGIIALFGDVAIDAFVPAGSMSDAQTAAVEKSLILAVHSQL